MSEQVIDLSDISSRIKRGWKGIALGGLAGGVIAFAYTWLVKPVYQADAAILVPEMQSMTGQLAAIGLQQPANGVGVLAGVLQSQSTTAAVAKTLGIKVREVADSLSITSDTQTGQVHLSARFRDSDKALKAVSSALENAKTLDQEVGLSLASRQAIELRKAVDARRKVLAQTEDALLKYQRSAKTYTGGTDDVAGSSYLKRLQTLDLQLKQTESQLKAVRTTAAKGTQASPLPSGRLQTQELREKMLTAESEFNRAKQKFTPQAPEYRDAQRSYEAVRQAFADETRRYVESVMKGVDEKTAALEVQRLVLENDVAIARRLAEVAPGEALEFSRLARNVRAAEESLRQVATQYERAKVDAETSRVRWLVLDAPYLQEKPVNKNYKINVALFGLLGLVAGTIFVTSRGK